MTHKEKSRELEALSAAELKALLRQDMDTEGDGLPTEVIMQAVSRLQDLERADGSCPPVDTEVALAQFSSRHLCVTKTSPSATSAIKRPVAKKFSLRQFAATAAAILCILFTGTITAMAMGLDVWGAIANWTSETFRFEVTQQGIPFEGDSALNPLGKNLDDTEFVASLTPSWYPSGYELTESILTENEAEQFYFLAFESSDGGYFSILLSKFKTLEAASGAILEKSDTPVETYERGDMCFYLMQNANTMTASWSNGLLTEVISGSLTEEDLKSMIDSIGGVPK